MLKDHNSAEAKRLITLSQTRMIRDAARERGFVLNDITLQETETTSVKPVQLWLKENLDEQCRHEIIDGLDRMSHIDFDVKLINKCKDLGNTYSSIYFHLKNICNESESGEILRN